MNIKQSHLTIVVSLLTVLLMNSCWADEREDGWVTVHVAGTAVATFELPIHPRGESRPALKHRLIPDPFDQVEGNAAIHYLKAIGFIEQTAARRAIEQFEQEQEKLAGKLGFHDHPPHSWMKTPPAILPIEETKQFLSYLSFQPPLIQAATHRRSFHLDRNLRQEDSPLMVLLPEIQQLRSLGRYQSLRARLAIAEDRAEDAAEIIGQQYALTRHLGSDEIFVPNLVGAAIANIAFHDTVHLLGHREAPNLYWAFASLPQPLIDMTRASSYERQFLFEQVKCLREVTDKVRPEGYWEEFVDQFQSEFTPILQIEGGEADTDLAAKINQAYPGAQKYLVEKCGMTAEECKTYPQIQAVLLAVKRYYESARDDQFKWDYVPYSKLRQNSEYPSIEAQSVKDKERYGWITEPANLILPALLAIRAAKERTQQQIGLAQTVEAIRIHAFENDRQLPNRLEDLRLPAPNDSVSGEAFSYQLEDGNATLQGAIVGNIQYRLELSIADE